MGITPIDIQQHQFRVKFRGFDVQEVDTFLDQVAETLGRLMDEREALKGEIERQKGDLASFRDREETFKRMVLSSQKTMEQMKENAQKAAEVTLAEAEVKAEKILNRAHNRLAQLHEDMAELKRQRTQLEVQLRSVLEAHSRMLDMGKEEEKTLDAEESKLRIFQK